MAEIQRMAIGVVDLDLHVVCLRLDSLVADEDLEPAKLRLRPIESCRLGIAVDDDGADLDSDGRSRRKIVFLAVFLQNDLDWIVLFDLCRMDMVEAFNGSIL